MTVLWMTNKLLALECNICVDFREEEKSEYSDKNHRSTGEINYGNSTHMKRVHHT